MIATELSQKAAEAEVSAVYKDAKARHEQNMMEINKAIAEVQQDVQQINADIRGKRAARAE